jgi:hypothetical protein
VPPRGDDRGLPAASSPVLPALDGGPVDLDDVEGTPHGELIAGLARSARVAGRGAVISGRWLADTVLDMAPRVPVRDAETVSRHHDGLTGAALARSMIRSSGRVSAAVGAAAGGLIAVQEVSVGGIILIPFVLAAETVLVVLVELKLVAELHHVAGRPVVGSPAEWVAAVVRSWLSGRGITGATLATAGRFDLLGRATRVRLTGALRRRFTRNLTSMIPFMAGAAVAATLNRRATIDVGHRLAADLGLGR